MIIVYAPRVHTGGGLILLKVIIETLGAKAIAILDSRCTVEAAPGAQVIRVAGGLRSYWTAERRLQELAKLHPGASVLCLSSLPPFRRLTNRTVVFLQNRYVVESRRDFPFSLKVRIRHWLEQLWFQQLCQNGHVYFVQSETMRTLLATRFPKLDVRVVPFLDQPQAALAPIGVSVGQKYDFVYVAAPYSHKNHERLVQAWSILADDGFYPSLALAFPEDWDDGMWARIQSESARAKTKIFRLKAVFDDRFLIYSTAKALIFPSLFETYGLPLVEAAAVGLPILASELDYVRDSVTPQETFDPNSALSIARAVRRFLGQPSVPLAPLTPEGFLAQVKGSGSAV